MASGLLTGSNNPYSDKLNKSNVLQAVGSTPKQEEERKRKSHGSSQPRPTPEPAPVVQETPPTQRVDAPKTVSLPSAKDVQTRTLTQQIENPQSAKEAFTPERARYVASEYSSRFVRGLGSLAYGAVTFVPNLIKNPFKTAKGAGLGMAKGISALGVQTAPSGKASDIVGTPGEAGEKLAFEAPFLAFGVYEGIKSFKASTGNQPVISRETGVSNVRPTGQKIAGERTYDTYEGSGKSIIVSKAGGKQFKEEILFESKAGVSPVNEKVSTIVGVSKVESYEPSFYFSSKGDNVLFRGFQMEQGKYTMSEVLGKSLKSGKKSVSLGISKELENAPDTFSFFAGKTYAPNSVTQSTFLIKNLPPVSEGGIISIAKSAGKSSSTGAGTVSVQTQAKATASFGAIAQGTTALVLQKAVAVAPVTSIVAGGFVQSLKSEQKIKQVGFQSQGSALSQLGLTGQMNKYKMALGQSTGLQAVQGQRITPLSGQDIGFVNIQQSRASQTQSLQQGQVNPFSPEVILPSISPIALTAPIALGFGGFDFGSSTGRRSSLGRQKQKRTPSLYAVIENKTGKASRLDLTGLSIRPIISKRRK